MFKDIYDDQRYDNPCNDRVRDEGLRIRYDIFESKAQGSNGKRNVLRQWQGKKVKRFVPLLNIHAALNRFWNADQLVTVKGFIGSKRSDAIPWHWIISTRGFVGKRPILTIGCATWGPKETQKIIAAMRRAVQAAR